MYLRCDATVTGAIEWASVMDEQAPDTLHKMQWLKGTVVKNHSR